MKLQSLLLAVLASSPGLATPLGQDIKRPIYNLCLTSPVPALNGAYLSTKGTLVGVWADAPASAHIRVYIVENPATGLSELHTLTMPAPDPSDKALALLGKDGLLNLHNVKVHWTSFRLEDQGRNITYSAGGGGQWVAFPAGNGGADWSVSWKEADAFTTADYMPVQLVCTPVHLGCKPVQ